MLRLDFMNDLVAAMAVLSEILVYTWKLPCEDASAGAISPGRESIHESTTGI